MTYIVTATTTSYDPYRYSNYYVFMLSTDTAPIMSMIYTVTTPITSLRSIWLQQPLRSYDLYCYSNYYVFMIYPVTTTTTTTEAITTTTTTTTTSSSTSGINQQSVNNTQNTSIQKEPTQKPTTYVMPGYSGPTGCAMPMSSESFNTAKNSISSKSFEDSKLTIAKQVVGNNCLICSQVKEIMKLFSFEDTRLEFAKFAYKHTFDIGNYYQLNDAFTFEASIDELNQYISNGGN